MSRTPGFKALQRAFRQSLQKQIDPSRREFLKSSVAMGLTAVPLTTLIANCAAAPKSVAGDGGTPDFVVLGGGVSGLTAAYRLSKAGVACAVYEAQSRMGGRIFTHDQFNSEGMFCELGGELIDSSHEDLLGLAEELGLETDDFRPDDKGLVEHSFYFDGKHHSDDDLTRASGPLAKRLLKDMREVLKDLDDPVVTYNSHTDAAKRFDRISLQAYLESFKDVDKWVRDALNMAYLTEFGLDTGEQSCINLMALVNPQSANGFGIYGESDEALRIRGGNSRLIEALTRAVEPRAPIHREHRLVRIADKGSSLALTFDQGGKSVTVSASRVICTLPFSVLRDVEGISTLNLSPVKHKAIAQIGYGTNSKRMLGFSDRPWRRAQGSRPAATGYTFTELASQTLWDSSRAQPGRSGIITTFLGGRAGADPQRGSIESILKDMETMFPGSRALHDGSDARFRWPEHPFSKGSYACPRLGQYTTIIGSAKEPELGGRLLFAGEHTSERYQGYMNGAVQSANLVTSAILKKRA